MVGVRIPVPQPKSSGSEPEVFRIEVEAPLSGYLAGQRGFMIFVPDILDVICNGVSLVLWRFPWRVARLAIAASSSLRRGLIPIREWVTLWSLPRPCGPGDR